MNLTHQCSICNKSIVKSQLARHLATAKHQQNEALLNPPSVTENNDEVVLDKTDDEHDETENSFLGDLTNINFKPSLILDEPKMKEVKIKKQKVSKTPLCNDDDSLFSDRPTEILGSDKLLLINKVKNYKLLFPRELKTFKIKKNASIEELNNALDEIQTLISIGSVDSFIIQGILESIKVIEGFSALTRFDIRGLADILSNNPQFHSLAKMIFLKYGGNFATVPPEVQMIFIIATSTFIVLQENKKMKVNNVLNQPVL